MNRRTTLLALGGALPFAFAARKASAQTPPISILTWQAITLQYGTLAKTTSQLALLRSTNTYVRDFAVGEIEEQTAFAQALTASPNPPPAPLNAQQTAMISALETTAAASFDAAYLNLQITGHEILLQTQEALLADGYAYTVPAVQQASVAKAFIQNHLVALSLLVGYNQ